MENIMKKSLIAIALGLLSVAAAHAGTVQLNCNDKDGKATSEDGSYTSVASFGLTLNETDGTVTTLDSVLAAAPSMSVRLLPGTYSAVFSDTSVSWSQGLVCNQCEAIVDHVSLNRMTGLLIWTLDPRRMDYFQCAAVSKQF
jgi:hypothetical protein